MKSNSFFIKSYSDLKEFLKKTDVLLHGIIKDDWGCFKVQLAMLAINRLDSQHLERLLTNDYFENLVPEIKNYANQTGAFRLIQYENIINFLLTELSNKKKIRKIHYDESEFICEIEANCGSCFIIHKPHLIINKLVDSGVILHSQAGKVNLESLKFFQKVSASLKIEKNNPRLKYSIDILKLASIYSMLTFLFDMQEDQKSSFINAEEENFFCKNGYLIKENFVKGAILNDLRETTYKLAEKQKKDGTAYLYGKNKNLQRIYNLIGKSNSYVDLLLDKRLKEILENFFERDTLHQKYYLSSFQANILYPGAESQILHTDLAVPDPLPDWPIRLNLNITLDEFNEINGGTLVLPGSHKFLRKPNPVDSKIELINLKAPPGSLIIWTGHLWHKSGTNNSLNSRAALLACFAASYFREIAVEENYLHINSTAKLEEFPERLYELIGGNHGVKKSAQI